MDGLLGYINLNLLYKMKLKLLITIGCVVFLVGGGIAWKQSDRNKKPGPEGTNGYYYIPFDTRTMSFRIEEPGTRNVATDQILGWDSTTEYVGKLGTFSGLLSANSTITTMQSNIAGKYNTPTGTTSQYVRGDGTLGTTPLPQIQSDWNQANNALADYIKNKPTITNYTAGSGISIASGVISNTAQYVAPTFNNSATKTLNGSGVQLSTTRNAMVTYTVTHNVALTLLVTTGSSQVYLEVSPNNSTWSTISQAGFTKGVTVAVALNDSATNNVQGNVPAGWYVRLRSVVTGGGSASFTNGQETLF